MENNKAKITVEVRISLPVEKAWAYWTDPGHITQWNNASDDWHTPAASNDLRVDGRFVSRMEAKDGSFGFDFGGVYDEVTLYKTIGYTMDDDRKCWITFTSEEGMTRIVETFEAEDENSIELQRTGWQAIMDNFKKYAESI